MVTQKNSTHVCLPTLPQGQLFLYLSFMSPHDSAAVANCSSRLSDLRKETGFYKTEREVPHAPYTIHCFVARPFVLNTVHKLPRLRRVIEATHFLIFSEPVMTSLRLMKKDFKRSIPLTALNAFE
jgi:hypothetical protein